METAEIRKNTLKKVISLMSLGVNLISSNPSLNVSWPRCFRVEGIGGGEPTNFYYPNEKYDFCCGEFWRGGGSFSNDVYLPY